MPLQQIYIEEAMKIKKLFNINICFVSVYFGNNLIHDGERLVYINSLEILLEERSSYAAIFSFTFDRLQHSRLRTAYHCEESVV